MTIKKAALLLACLFSVALPANAAAQGGDGSLRGIVTDESGAAMPGVTVTATSPQAIAPAVAVTDASGEYRLTNLAPGSYTFNVKAANSSGTWNRNITQLRIEITPPFWATVWAYIIYVVVAIAIILWLMQLYHNRHLEKNRRKIELMEHEKEKELYQAKIEFFTNVAHEIRTPLTLIKAPMEKLIKNAADMPNVNGYLKTMEKNTNRLVELTNELLDFRKTETSEETCPRNTNAFSSPMSEV